MSISSYSPDFPLTLMSREEEITEASNIASINSRVRSFFESLVNQGGYCLGINGQNILLEGPQDADTAYRLFLASPKTNQEYRRRQAEMYIHKI